MKKRKIVLTQDEVTRMLLKLLAQCYASEKEAIKDSGVSATLGVPIGFKAYVAKEDKWSCFNTYTVGEAGNSWGSVVLYYRDHLIFYMSFGGYVALYLCEQFGINPKQVTDFLKQALLAQYSQWEQGLKAFLGGRGPFNFIGTEDIIKDQKLRYRNRPLGGHAIHTVQGRDYIELIGPTKGMPTELLYHHDYLGGLLIEAE